MILLETYLLPTDDPNIVMVRVVEEPFPIHNLNLRVMVLFFLISLLITWLPLVLGGHDAEGH